MARRLYSLLVYLLTPLFCAFLLWRGVRERGYLRHFGERFGLGAVLLAPSGAQGSIWVHAASVGEVQAASPLVRALRRRSDAPIVLTTATPAGAARARTLLHSEAIEVRHVPLDLPGAVRRFFARVHPRLALILETELWPNLFHECARRGVPVVLASARVSERSARRYRLVRGLLEGMLAQVALVAAQSAADAERFRALGANAARTHVIGNIKFDFSVPAETATKALALREQHARDRALWVAGSTHRGEEQAVLEAHARVRAVQRGTLLVLAPRHPQRFAEVAALLELHRLRFARRSQGEVCGADTQVLLLDTLGELLDFYAASDVAFVGGSLVAVGGHNLVEPAALGKPILTGPHTANNAEMVKLLSERQALRVVSDIPALAAGVTELLTNAELRAAMGARARAVAEENRGALARLLALIEPVVQAAAPERAA
ncbi:MAG TPA: lipid IV(A) 3-deoxy-D-manno-octulosonic acid transferase [Steroidobacteraceae bacterium]|nr:lipid IV(A) 3-deoxy-D-manno-octulosonic acid transferase [Steroidobacteraceae bacterium]